MPRMQGEERLAKPFTPVRFWWAPSALASGIWLARALCAAFSGRFLFRLIPVVADYLDVKLAHDWPTASFTASNFRCRRTWVQQ